MPNKKMVVRINILNAQNDYAECLALIEAIENDKTDGYCPEIENTDKYQFYTESGKANSLDFEKKSSLIELFENREHVAFSSITSINVLKSMALGHIRHYYLRVSTIVDGNNGDTIGNTDIINLQYLILLLQRFKNDKSLSSLFTVYFPDLTVYHKYSSYLRFVLDEYDCIYGSFVERESKTLKYVRLSKKPAGTLSKFFPLIEINDQNIKLLRNSMDYYYGKLVDEDKFMPWARSQLDELKQMARAMLADRIPGSKKNQDKAALEHLDKNSYNLHQNNILVYALYCLTVDVNFTELETQRHIAVLVQLVHGLMQAMQNVNHHSEKGRGTLSLRVHSRPQYIREQYSIENDSNLDYLEIVISDTNLKYDIIDHFINKTAAQYIEIGTFKLEKKQIRLEDFLYKIRDWVEVEREDEAERERVKKWLDFRVENPYLCHGLPILVEKIKALHGLLKIKSSFHYVKDANHDGCLKNFLPKTDIKLSVEKKTQQVQPYKKKSRVDFEIPGTQVAVLFQIHGIAQKQGSDSGVSDLDRLIANPGWPGTVFKGYSRYIESEALEITNSFDNLIKELSAATAEYAGQALKEAMREYWYNTFTEKLKGITLEQIPFLNFSVPGKIDELLFEPLSKALILYILRSQQTNGQQFCIAFINAPITFWHTLLNTFIHYGSDFKAPIQIYLYSKDGNKEKELLLAGSSVHAALKNARHYSFVRGLPYELHQKEGEINNSQPPTGLQEINLIPFDVILPIKPGGREKIIDDYLKKVIGQELTDTSSPGYRLNNAHMRLGSKVHLNQFFEATTLFQKPHIAQKIALQILRDVRQSEHAINLAEDPILFYGYASYSRLILSMLMETIYDIRTAANRSNLEFAIYQNDLPASDNESGVKIYYSHGRGSTSGRRPINKSVKIIQIVPISSTLTTFNKMWQKFNEDNMIDHSDGYGGQNGTDASQPLELAPFMNYALFWVRDESGTDDTPSGIEKEYWSKIIDHCKIETKLITPAPVFFVTQKAQWHRPTECDLCYPPVPLKERHLIETDATSTIPAIQFDRPERTSRNDELQAQHEYNNQQRIALLDGCVQYGHLYRGKNHYQYYIDTGRLFLNAREEIRSWLEDMRNKAQRSYADGALHIIVTPVNQTNVEFCHYVNQYYFSSCANVIILDPIKEYRTNFEAKYAEFKS